MNEPLPARQRDPPRAHPSHAARRRQLHGQHPRRRHDEAHRRSSRRLRLPLLPHQGGHGRHRPHRLPPPRAGRQPRAPARQRQLLRQDVGGGRGARRGRGSHDRDGQRTPTRPTWSSSPSATAASPSRCRRWSPRRRNRSTGTPKRRSGGASGSPNASRPTTEPASGGQAVAGAGAASSSLSNS